MEGELANDRTYLAWLRTAIASMGLGVVVAKIALIVTQGKPVSNENLFAGVGIGFVVCGAALILVEFFQHLTVGRSLDPARSAARPLWPLMISLLTVAGAGVLSVLLGVTA
jgi:putative membrane protein